MNKEGEVSLVYHIKHGRSMPGCLPLFVLIAGACVVLGLMFVEVRKPEPLRPRGEGNVYYRNDELLHFHAFQRSPLPFRLPASIDPAQTPDREMPPLSPERKVELLPAPAPSLFGSAPDSAVLEKASLLRLPPPEEEIPAAEPSPESESGDSSSRERESPAAAPPLTEESSSGKEAQP